jgi:hypothetical protein
MEAIKTIDVFEQKYCCGSCPASARGIFLIVQFAAGTLAR